MSHHDLYYSWECSLCEARGKFRIHPANDIHDNRAAIMETAHEEINFPDTCFGTVRSHPMNEEDFLISDLEEDTPAEPGVTLDYVLNKYAEQYCENIFALHVQKGGDPPTDDERERASRGMRSAFFSGMGTAAQMLMECDGSLSAQHIQNTLIAMSKAEGTPVTHCKIDGGMR